MIEIHLLGPPRIVRDGAAVQGPRGNKSWGLLAYLLLRETPASRMHLAELLFPKADDPLAALRWTLSMLRRLLGDAGTVHGDPLTVSWKEPPVVDVLQIRSAGPDQAGALDDAGLELLESLQFPDCPSFEIWLQAQRRRARGAGEALLHEAALSRLAREDADGSADLAARLVGLNPYDENFQALLIRSLATSGRGVEAARQAAAARHLFRTELGIEPGPALEAAALTMTADPTRRAVTGRPAVQALLDAGQAAIGAGALEAGLQCLRRAVADAGVLRDGALQAEGFTLLGSALVHAARGSDEEGATSLHRALTIDGAEPGTLCDALTELAYIEFLQARYDRVETWLAKADTVRCGPEQRAAALVVRGSSLSDLARYDEAMDVLQQAFELSRDDRRQAYVLSMTGRIHLLRGEHDTAAGVLDESISRATEAGWSAFLPWPESLRAGADLACGDLDAALKRLEHAFMLGCQIGDPCWEGLAARGLGLVQAARGDVAGGIGRLLDARRRAARLPDAYVWVQGYVLDALVDVGVEHGLEQAGAWSAELSVLAERTGMAEFATHARASRPGRIG